MTARNCCAAAADNNLLSLPDLPWPRPMVRCSRHAALHSFGEAARQKHHETNFLFFISRLALIDAILLTGIAFHQIR